MAVSCRVTVYTKILTRSDQVFGETHQEPFSAWEAAEYLEVSVPTLRRYVQSGKLVPSHVVGRNQMFSAQTLRAFKRSRGSRG